MLIEGSIILVGVENRVYVYRADKMRDKFILLVHLYQITIILNDIDREYDF